jgi:hypothetical protein
MSTRTKLAIAALILASSASGVLAQSQIGNGLPAELTSPGASAYYVAPQSPRHVHAPAKGHQTPGAGVY